MAKVTTQNINRLGYDFIPDTYLPQGENEYYLRNRQSASDRTYRNLTPTEIRDLKNNNNYCPDWSKIYVSEHFDADYVQNCKFYGLVRIGNIEPVYLEYRDLQLACGLYNSQIVSCDIGDRVAIHQVRYMAHFIVGNQVILSNINEMETSSNAKFGNGILKEGDPEDRRIWLELCNENGGRSVLPFDGMQAADAYLWTRNRQDEMLQQRFLEMTERKFTPHHGYYSEIGDHVVMKNSDIVKDVRIGPCAYIKGVNKLKNLTINSTEEAYTQIGEGCELVNGIIGHGCRIFYGVKAVRFVLSSFSQLKYGARLINSFLGDNSTISCCEVLNSLLFPAHEQHHNNSFLCAALIHGQSNMAAGATIGSNHNSRAADGEVLAKRGFWPGLCVSIKHNSRFASYTLLVKGDFLHELDVRIPFSLVSNDPYENRLLVLPGYWFLYNMYALMRNNTKFAARDKRKFKNQYIEYDILAPDTVNEMFDALAEIQRAVGKAFSKEYPHMDVQVLGKEVLESDMDMQGREILLEKTENSKRKVVLLKVKEAYQLFRRIIKYYGALQMAAYCGKHGIAHLLDGLNSMTQGRAVFENIGGQLIPQNEVNLLLEQIKRGELQSWDEVHQRYHGWSKLYLENKFQHALSSLAEICDRPMASWDQTFVLECLTESVATKTWIYSQLQQSRAKDYECDFKQMLYNSYDEMEAVVGKLSENTFIRQQKAELEAYIADVERIGAAAAVS